MPRWLLRLVTLAMSVATLAVSAPTVAQSLPTGPQPRDVVDANHVDLATYWFELDEKLITIGGDDSGLSFIRHWKYGRWTHDFSGYVFEDTDPDSPSYGRITVVIGAKRTVFEGVSGNQEGDGATISTNGSDYTFRTSDGTIYFFDSSLVAAGSYGTNGYLTSITRPDSEKIVITYQLGSYSYCGYYDINTGQCAATYTSGDARARSVQSSYGYQLKLSYALGSLTSANAAEWGYPSKIQAINSAVEYCDPAAATCSLTNSWPEVNLSRTAAGGNVYDSVTDAAGRTTRYTLNANSQVLAIKPPAASGDTITYVDNGAGALTVTTPSGSWSYASSVSGPTKTVAITGPLAHTDYAYFNNAKRRLTSWKDALNRVSSYGYDNQGRMTSVTGPESQETDYTYDARGNVLQTVRKPKPGSALGNIVTSATYPASCTATITCNKPITTTDAIGGVTDYVYDATHGGVLSVTQPAPSGGAARPQTRYAYTALYPYYKNASGVIAAAAAPIYKLTGTSTCATGSSCVGAASESVTTVAYGSAGVANNRLPTATTMMAGDGSVSATTAMSYDAVGNVAAIDGPLAGSADTATQFYNADRQVTLAVGPDPDGGGPLANRAEATSYNLNGQIISMSQGTANPNGTGFSALQTATTSYDGSWRKASETLSAGGATYSVRQYSYDAADRLTCTALRMNPAGFGSLPASACMAGTAGSYGPDRITYTQYDATDAVTVVTDGYGTAQQRAVATTSYGAGGLPATQRDANGNLTTYEYDGFDRLVKTRYPSPVTAGVSSTTDYEALTLDALGRVTQRRLRDGNVIGYGYDALGRLVAKDVPNVAIHEYDIGYQYDLLGRLIMASDTNGHFTSPAYNALGQQVSEQSNWTTRQWQYDTAGRRTRLTWGDGFYVTYEYDATGAVSAIRENGGLALASYVYDNLGRRTSVTRGNGTVTSYGYDAVSRLASLSQDMSGTASDIVLDYNYNPAGQIVSRTSSNAAYAWGGAVSVNRSYVVNGLNQYTQSGGVALGYDGRGNLTSSGSATYGYTSENRLATGPGGIVMTYDPLGRYHWLSDGGPAGPTWMQYDGANLIEERTGAGVVRRYVYGPGDDEPIVWYEGSGTGDKRWLHADERGSVIALTDAAGTATALNSYDEYGIPAAGNVGRFGYTGQAWLPELGLFYYKARLYSPTLGRFLQSDPIDYGDGLNMYAYTHNDPVNATDPSGLLKQQVASEFSCGEVGQPQCQCPTGDSGTHIGATLYCPSTQVVVNALPLPTARNVVGSRQPSLSQKDILNHDIGADAVVIAKKVPKPVQKFISDWIVDYNCGFIDSSACSWSDYTSIAGYLLAGPVARFAWFGREIKIGKNFRLAPFGNRTGHPLGRWPHYHYRPSNPAPPGQGIGRHRPWE